MQTLRTVNSVKKRLDAMIKKSKMPVIGYGSGSYRFDHYDYDEPTFTNSFTASLDVYYVDGMTQKPKFYVTLTDENLRKPSSYDGQGWFVDCHWDSKWPDSIYIREYEHKN